jgi:hypothetical protein
MVDLDAGTVDFISGVAEAFRVVGWVEIDLNKRTGSC